MEHSSGTYSGWSWHLLSESLWKACMQMGKWDSWCKPRQAHDSFHQALSLTVYYTTRKPSERSRSSCYTGSWAVEGTTHSREFTEYMHRCPVTASIQRVWLCCVGVRAPTRSYLLAFHSLNTHHICSAYLSVVSGPALGGHAAHSSGSWASQPGHTGPHRGCCLWWPAAGLKGGGWTGSRQTGRSLSPL